MSVQGRLRRALLESPQVIDALQALHAIGKDGERLRYSCCCCDASDSLAGVLSASDIDHYARVVRERVAAGVWPGFGISVGDGVGRLHGRGGERVRKGPAPRTIELAAGLLARRLDADRHREPPEPASDAERQALSEVLAFLDLPALPRPVPLAQPAGADPEPEELARVERKRAKAARQRERRRGGRNPEPAPSCEHDWQEPCEALREAIELDVLFMSDDRLVAECSRCGQPRIEPAAQTPERKPAEPESEHERRLARIREEVESGELVIRRATPAEREAWAGER